MSPNVRIITAIHIEMCYVLGPVTTPLPMTTSVTVSCSGWRQWVVPGHADVANPTFNYKVQYRVSGSDP